MFARQNIDTNQSASMIESRDDNDRRPDGNNKPGSRCKTRKVTKSDSNPSQNPK